MRQKTSFYKYFDDDIPKIFVIAARAQELSGGKQELNPSIIQKLKAKEIRFRTARLTIFTEGVMINGFKCRSIREDPSIISFKSL